MKVVPIIQLKDYSINNVIPSCISKIDGVELDSWKNKAFVVGDLYEYK